MAGLMGWGIAGCAVALIGLPAYPGGQAPARSLAAVCGEDPAVAEDCGCAPDAPECAAPEAPAPPVIVPGRRPDVNACVNLGGRRRVSVSGCI